MIAHCDLDLMLRLLLIFSIFSCDFWLFSWGNVYENSLPVLILSFYYLVLSVFYIFCTQVPFLDIRFAKMSSRYVVCHFTFLMLSLVAQKFSVLL